LIGIGATASAGALLPFALAYGIGHGTNAASRNRQEARTEAALTECMRARRYTITSWRVLKKDDETDFSTPVFYSKPQ